MKTTRATPGARPPGRPPGSGREDASATTSGARQRQAIEPIDQQHYDSALSLWEAGRKKQAVAELEIALKAAPNRADRWCQLGEFYDALGAEALLQNNHREADRLRKKAVVALTRAIARSPDFAKAHFALAEVHWGRDFRSALAELEAAAKYDPHEYGSVFEQARTTVRECAYRLARMNTVVLGSAQAPPRSRMLETEFLFTPCRIGCAVMHSCVSENERAWAHVWLFESEHPDLKRDEPVAELTISSTGDVSIAEGCPADYHESKARVGGSGVLAGWLGTKGPPASYVSPSETGVEDGGIPAASDLPPPRAAPDKVDSQARFAAPTQRRRPDPPRARAPVPRFDTSKILTEALPPDRDTGGVVPAAAVKSPDEVSYARSRRRIVWTCLGVVLIAAAGSQFYFDSVSAVRTSEREAPVSIESTGLPPKAASAAGPESDGPATFEPNPLNPEPPTAAPQPASPVTMSSADPAPIMRPIQPPSPAKPQPLKAVDPQPWPGLSAPIEAEAAQATTVDPPRQPTRTEPVVAEAKQSPTAPLPAESAMDRMRNELAQCGQLGLLQRGVCVERIRWNHCHPDGWNKSPECAAR